MNFYKGSEKTLLNLDNILYVRKTIDVVYKSEKKEFCVDIVYGLKDCRVRYGFNTEKERDDWFDEFAKDVGAIL